MTVLLCLAGFGQALAQGAGGPTASVESAVTITNFHPVADRIYRSARPTPQQFVELAQLGVKTVLTLESETADPAVALAESQAALTHGLRLIRVPIQPQPTEKPAIATIEAALKHLRDPALYPILIHCHHGADRTGIVVGAYRVRVDKWKPEQAIKEMRALGHHPSLYFWDSLLYEFD